MKWFFPEGLDIIERKIVTDLAKGLCSGCEVKGDCGRYVQGMAAHDRYGIWAGVHFEAGKVRKT